MMSLTHTMNETRNESRKDEMRTFRRACLVMCIAFGVLSVPDRALATFPGDNGEIAYVRFLARTTAFSVRTVLPDGSPGRRLAARNTSIDAEWSPDDTALALHVTRGEERIVLQDAATAERTLIVRVSDVPGAELFESIAFGPTGDALVVCVRTGRSRTALYTIDADGSNLTAVSDRPDCYADWSSTNRIVATSGNASSLVKRIVTMDPDGTNRLLVASMPIGSLGEGLSVAPSWAPDGSVFVYAARTDYRSTSQDLYVVGGDGSGLTLLTGTGDTTEYGPLFSPDGAKIVFVRSRGSAFGRSRSDLFIMRTDGSGVRRLTDTPNRNEFTRSWRSTLA